MNLMKVALASIIKTSASIHWEKPSFNDEAEEFQRVSEEEDIPLDDLFEAFKEAKPIDLSDNYWSKLKNTDSFEIDNMEQADELAESYNRDLNSIVDAIVKNKSLPMPIILQMESGDMTLISGNTRLMVCRASDIIPKVLLVTL